MQKYQIFIFFTLYNTIIQYEVELLVDIEQ